jgi:hypothetical protein
VCFCVYTHQVEIWLYKILQLFIKLLPEKTMKKAYIYLSINPRPISTLMSWPTAEQFSSMYRRDQWIVTYVVGLKKWLTSTDPVLVIIITFKIQWEILSSSIDNLTLYKIQFLHGHLRRKLKQLYLNFGILLHLSLVNKAHVRRQAG